MQTNDVMTPQKAGKNGKAAAETAAINDLPSQPALQRPTTLLTPAVQRVIAWHQQRLSARTGVPGRG